MSLTPLAYTDVTDAFGCHSTAAASAVKVYGSAVKVYGLKYHCFYWDQSCLEW